MDEKKLVYCPYCGKQMELKLIGDRYYYYVCRNHVLTEELDNTDGICAAETPKSQTPEGAHRKATALYKPMMKPMECLQVYLHIGRGITETETDQDLLLKYMNARPLYLEINPKFACTRELGRFDKRYCYPWLGPEDIKKMLGRKKYQYGQTYRFWWEEPTEEESEAAAWEE